MFFKALTNVVLQHEYSLVTDTNGNDHIKQRYFIIDELGSAGNISALERLMSEGRSFGVHVALGVHQLSQMRATYGHEGADTILGLCSYAALLKAGDPLTAKWMSERIGDILPECEIQVADFLNLPNLGTTGKISGYFIAPSLPILRADIPFDSLAPCLENPGALQ